MTGPIVVDDALLAELKDKAKAVQATWTLGTKLTVHPDVALALIARIEELEKYDFE